MYVVYAFDKHDKIILNHHYQRYFHLEEKKIFMKRIFLEKVSLAIN
jgi:hypothetical protein